MNHKPFRVWDSQVLQEYVKHAIQMHSKIAEICSENSVTPQQLPDSIVPTKHLYYMALSFEAMYEKLLEYDLVKTGNLKTNHTNNIH